MNKIILIRTMFLGLGVLFLVVLYFVFVMFYIFGPLAFNPPEAKPHFIIDMFFYKEYFVIGLIHLALLVAVAMSFIVVFRTQKQIINKTLLSYLLVLVFFLAQILWSSFLRGGTLPQLKERERILQEQEKLNFKN